MMRVIKVFSDEEFCLEASVVHARSQAPAWERTVSEAPAPGLPAMIQQSAARTCNSIDPQAEPGNQERIEQSLV